MARVQEVIVRKAPPPPPPSRTAKAREESLSLAELQRKALESDPHSRIVDRVFATKQSVENAAFRVNSGERRSWPVEKYFAVWAHNPRAKYTVRNAEGETEKKTGGWELLIGVRPHIPEGWEDKVNAPGSRKRAASGSDDAVEPQQDQTPQQSYEDQHAAAPQEHSDGHDFASA